MISPSNVVAEEEESEEKDISVYKDTKCEHYAKRICICFRKAITRMKNRRIAEYEKQLASKVISKSTMRDLRFQLFAEFGPSQGKDITDLYNELTLKRGWLEEGDGP